MFSLFFRHEPHFYTKTQSQTVHISLPQRTMSSTSSASSPSSTSAATRQFVATTQLNTNLHDSQAWETTYSRFGPDVNPSLSFMAYATGAPRGASWIRRKVKKGTGQQVYLSEVRNTITVVEQEVELGWIIPGHEPPSLRKRRWHSFGGGGGGGSRGPYAGYPGHPNPAAPGPGPVHAAHIPILPVDGALNSSTGPGAAPVFVQAPAAGFRPPQGTGGPPA